MWLGPELRRRSTVVRHTETTVRTSLRSGSSSARDSYAVAAHGRSFLVDARHRDG
jgi:hypothetical protein